MNELTHISLFSGIGGFDLAAEWAGFRTIAMCEIDPFCQEVLSARFGAVLANSEGKARFGAVEDPRCELRKGAKKQGDSNQKERNPSVFPERPTGSPRPLLFPDIRDFDGTRFRGATLLTGGFPCQPFSCAGKRGGKEDDRHLWPEMLRVIREAWPAWVLGENVSGIIGMELDQVLADLELEGYATRTFHIGAVGVNAPHRRMRVWIVGHNDEYGDKGEERKVSDREQSPATSRNSSSAQNSFSGGDGGRDNGDSLWLRWALQTQGPDSDAPDAAEQGLPHRRGPSLGESSEEPEFKRCGGDGSSAEQWDIPWIEVATRFCGMDAGLPAWVHARRVARLKALGNAIVPACVFPILQAIAQIEREKE